MSSKSTMVLTTPTANPTTDSTNAYIPWRFGQPGMQKRNKGYKESDH
ncbi:hypothetical protein [Corynebacterium glutamicum]|nr:hypothetical protein [Corynebacterium glutamicum]